MNTRKNFYRLLSIVLCIILVFSIIPMETFAADSTATPDECTEDIVNQDDKSLTDDETPEVSRSFTSEDGKWIYKVVDGYAVIMGYNDATVQDLSIPLKVDNYYVNGVGDRAFAENTSLSTLYIHGNVINISDNAFDGLNITLSGYNGTKVLSYAKDKGIKFINKTKTEYFTLTDKVIDFSYTEKGRYCIIGENQIKFGVPEAAQLKVGSVFYVPEVIGDLVDVYEVTSLTENGKWVNVSFTNADTEEALTRISMNDVELSPDWSKAEWADNVELVEEKVGGSFSLGGSQNIKFSYSPKKIPELTLSAEGKIGITGTASFDYSILKGELNELSAIIEPSLTFKGEIKLDSKYNTNEGEYLKSKFESVKKDGSSMEIYLGKVPLISVAHVVEIQAALYTKVDINGKFSITFKGSGRLGIEYNKATKSFKGVNEYSWSKPVLEASGSFAIGPAEAIQLSFAIVGPVMKLELFEGITGEVKWSSKQPECLDINLGYKIALTYKLQLDLLKFLSTNTEITLGEKTGNISLLHFEKGKLVSLCAYKDAFSVDFNTDCPETIDSQALKGGEKVAEPSISFIGHTLDGWYTDKKFTNKWDFDTDTVKSDITLYAKWQGTTKTVNYHTNYDKEDFSAEQEVGRTINKPSDPMWMDHRLEGWYKDSALTTKWDFSTDTMPNSNLDLYAKWIDDPGYDPYAASNVSSGEKTFNGHSYTHIATYMSYPEAKAYAEARGGYLATINSAEEQAFLQRYLYNDCAQTYLWLGMTNAYNWKFWATGEKTTYTNWSSTPTISSSQYNAAIIRNSGKWTTLSNNDTAHFVIEWGPYLVDPAAAASNNKQGVQYTYDNSTKTATVTGYTGNEKSLTIDASYNNYPVTAIVDNAFKNNTNLESISIPNSVTKIGASVFYGCTNLKSIVIPDSVTSIGTNAFQECKNLSAVSWSNKLTSIPTNTFYNCTNLSAVTNIRNVTKFDSYSFYNCNCLKTFTYPINLRSIGNYTFYNNRLLVNGNIPDSVYSIGTYAFYGCNSLTSITVPNSVSGVGTNTFYNCTSASTIVIPRTVTSITNNSFNNVNGTFKVYAGSVGETFCKNQNKTYRILPTTAARVSYNTGLTNNGNSLSVKDSNLINDVYIEAGKRVAEPDLSIDGYSVIGWYTEPTFVNRWDFANDTVNCENITLYAKWVQDESAFEYTVANGKATITDYVSENQVVIIPETLGGYPTTAIAGEAFESKAVTSIQIPSSITDIESGAFGYSENLFEITLIDNDNFKIIDGVLYTIDGARLICAPQNRSYISYTVLEGTTAIDSKAFANHPELNDIIVPDTVTKIYTDAFAGNYSLTIYGNVEPCAAKTFAEKYGYDYNIYCISFYNGIDMLYQTNIQAGTIVEDYFVPTDDVATFDGWYKDSALTQQWIFDEDIMPQDDINLYLKLRSDFTCVQNGSTITITGYNGSSSNIVIPNVINGYTVTGIGAGAFSSNISQITIPSSVIDIDIDAIPSNVKIISGETSVAHSYAETMGNPFEIRKYKVTFDSMGGSDLASIEAIPGSTLTLPTPIRTNYYFAGWYQVVGNSVEWNDQPMPEEDITLYALWRIANNNINDNFSYDILDDGTIEITAYTGTKSSLTIPETINGYTVSRIGDFAFKTNLTLLSVTVPNTVISIGKHAFADSSVRTIKGCENVKTIEEGAFSGAEDLRNIVLSEGLESIGYSAFFGCKNLFEIILPNNLEEIGARAFYDCSELDIVEFPVTLKTLGNEAFRNTNLTEVTLPSYVKNQTTGVFEKGVNISYVASEELSVLSIKQLTKSSIKIIWNNVKGAKEYKISRKVKDIGKFSGIKIVSDTNTFTYNINAGTTYVYRIQALDNEGKIIASDDAEITASELDLPVISSVVQNSSTTANMTIKKVNNADGYQVYRSNTYYGQYTLLKDITSLTTTNTGLIGGGDYYYKVRAYKNVSDIKVFSDWSEIYYFHMLSKFMTAPQNVVVYQTKPTTVDITWDEVEGAEGYFLYRNINDGAYSKVKAVTENHTQNYSLTTGTKYGYRIQAYFTENSATVSGDKSNSVKITISELTTPIITSVTQKTATTATISWSKVNDAEGYYLYRATEPNGTYSTIKSVTDTTAENYSLSQNQNYYYKVRAFKTDSDGTRVFSCYSPAFMISMNSLAQAELIDLSQVSPNSAELSWKKVPGADRYEIWASVNGISDYELVDDISDRIFTINNLIDGTDYYYKVRGYVLNNDEKSYGEFSEPMSINCIGTPTISIIEQSSANAVELLWSKVSGTSGYEIWRSINNEDYALAKTVTGNTTNNYNLVSQNTYSYMIRAFRTNENGTKTYGFFSSPAGIKILSTPSISKLIQNDTNTVTVDWNTVPGAEGYVLYRSEIVDGVYSFDSIVTDTSVQSSVPKTGITYYYKVAAYNTIDGVRKYSILSNVNYITVLDKPVITKIEKIRSSTVEITWSPVEKATGYRLYRSDTFDGTYSYVKSVTEPQTQNYSLTEEKYYYYKVSPYCEENGTTHLAPASDYLAYYLTNLATPVVTKREQPSDSELELAWKTVPDAEGYEIFRSDSEYGNYELIGSTNLVSFNDINVITNSIYYYKIRAYKLVDDERVYSSLSKSYGAAIMQIPVFEDILQATKTSVDIAWFNVPYAVSYKLYRSEDINGPYTQLKTVCDVKTSNYSLTTGNTYYYKIQAVTTDDGIISNVGPMSESIKITLCDLSNGKFTKVYQSDDNTIDLNWASVGGAEGYEVCIMNMDGIILETNDLATTSVSVDLSQDNLYKFKVRPYKTVDEEKLYGGYSPVAEMYLLSNPSGVSSYQDESGSVYLNWNDVPYAKDYTIYRKVQNGKYVKIATPINTSYQDETTVPGDVYTYKITANTDGIGQVSSGTGTEYTTIVCEYHADNYPESDHDYANNMNKTWSYSIPGASSITVKFNSSTAFESGYDKLYITDFNGSAVGSNYYSGTQLSGKTITVPGDTINLKLTTDGSVTRYGFSIDYIYPTFSTYVDAPVLTNVYQTNKSTARLTWNASTTATRYQIYRKENDGKYTSLKYVDDLTALSYSLNVGSQYSYKVRAIKELAGKTFVSDYSNELTLTVFDLPSGGFPQSPHVYENNTDKTWTYTVPGAARLELKFSDNTAFEWGDYLYITDGNGNNVGSASYTGNSLSGTTITVYDNAVNIRLVSNDALTDYGFSFDYIKPIFDSSVDVPVLNSISTTSNNEAIVSWNRVNAATHYELYRKTNIDAEYVKIAETTSLSFTDQTENNTAYFYEVRAVRTVFGQNYYSELSTPKVCYVSDGVNNDYPESAHPYGNSMSSTWSYTIEGAEALMIKFNVNTEFEANYDKLYITDSNGLPAGRTYYSGKSLSDATIIVKGDTVNLRMTTDSSITKYGFSIDYIIPTSAPEEPEPTLVYFDNGYNWENVNIYFWANGDSGPIAWPGVPMEQTEDGGWKFEVPAGYDMVIFNNTLGEQTADLSLPRENGKTYHIASNTWS